jgi:serine/threonine protein kinase/tetratricopeptide (TPR) repeat protein
MVVPRHDGRGAALSRDQERWQRAKQVLDEAIAVESGERASVLDRACDGDPELRREVESLLSAHEQAGSTFLKTAAVGLKAPSSPSRAGLRIGVYQIIKEIGHGGMGEVYRAARADGQYTKEVAIKLVRGGFDSRFVLERFLTERQILASLDHPNIARLLDGGSTDDGVPYLVMELIEGTPLDEHCDNNRLNVTERLKLFVQVCSAVQYAHQRLVIHRDIKPGNILVTKEGVPKLLDFGIAKILDPTDGSKTTLDRPFTPEYASPEQIRGEPITTASDVYSLGVVLYQLLTGRSPYPGKTSTAHELARAICETDPGRPSSVVIRQLIARSGETRPAPSLSEISAPREGSPARLRRRLAGDLDNIVLKALRKEPQFRYSSVEQLALDIRAHLDGRPVAATKGSWSYRARKFVVRNKVGVAASAAVALAIATGVGLTVREARIARHQAEIASIQKARAEKRFDDVRKLSDSLIFEVHDAIQNLPGATPARKLLLDRALDYLDSVSKDADGDADLERELAWGYQRIAVVQGNATESNLGDINASLASDRKALALFEAVAKANSEDAIDHLNVAMMHRILSYSSLTETSGRHDLERAMAISERLLKQDPTNPKIKSERSIEYQNLGLMRDFQGDRPGAIEAFRACRDLKLDILKTTPSYRRIRSGVGMADALYGMALARMGSREQGLKELEEGIRYFESMPKGEDEINVSRNLAIARQKRADILLMNGDTAGALKSYRETRSFLEPMSKADPQNTMLVSDVATMDYHEGRVLATEGHYREALSSLQRAAKVFKNLHTLGRPMDDAVHGPSDVDIWLGDTYAGLADLQSALQYYREAGADLEDTNPGETKVSEKDKSSMDDDTRCELGTVYVRTGRALMRLGELPEARVMVQKALDVSRASSATERRDVAALYVVADAQAALGDIAVAQTHDAVGEERARLKKEASASYEASTETWRQIPNPSVISPGGFLSHSRSRAR